MLFVGEALFWLEFLTKNEPERSSTALRARSAPVDVDVALATPCGRSANCAAIGVGASDVSCAYTFGVEGYMIPSGGLHSIRRQARLTSLRKHA